MKGKFPIQLHVGFFKMLTCKICNKKLYSLESFFLHIRYNHPSIEQIKCPYENCSRVYSNRSSIKKHVRNQSVHSGSLENFELTERDVTRTKLVVNGPVTGSNDTVSEIISNLKKEMMKHALKLLADELISRKKGFEMLRDSFECYSKAFLSLRTIENGLFMESSNFNEFCEFFSDPSSVQSEYKLKKALVNAGVYVLSNDFTLSSMNVLTFVNGEPKFRLDKRILKLFNVSEMLQKLFNLPNIMAEVDTFVKNMQLCSDGSISNIVQSPLWQKLLSFEKKDDSICYLPITIYYDDFEPLNVIGSHSGAYKIGATYMGLPFLPEHIISKLQYILPVCLFFSEDCKLYGNDKIFKPVIEILNDLYSTGINVNYKKIRTVKFIVTLILGDNLGLNGILSFSEGFNHNYYCRFCKAKKKVMQKQLIEDVSSLRNYDNYCADVLKDFAQTGIKENSIFNGIYRFHVTRNYSVDLLHDFLDGVCHYDLCNIIINLLKQNAFTLDELNSKIRYHNYGPFAKNKNLDPITPDMLNNCKIKCSGAEMQRLIINFSTIVGHCIKHDSPEWRLYLVLREILTIVTAKTIHRRTHELLANLVSEHHQRYLLCFPGDTLKPKHHFMVHYPRILQRIGPLSTVSCMRYESYHKKFKNISKVISCRINLLKTFATKIEFQFANFLLRFTKTLDEPSFGKIETVEITSLFRKYNFTFDAKEIVLSGWVDVGGVLVKRNCVIQTGVEIDDSPTFALVTDIIIIDKSKIMLGCQKITNLGFHHHFYAFSVCLEDEFFVCDFLKDNIKKVSYIFDSSNFKKYVSF